MSILEAASEAVDTRWKTYVPLLEYMGGPRVYAWGWPNDPDLPKPDTPYKYITIGEMTETEAGVLGPVGSNMTIQAHGWTWGYYENVQVQRLVKLMNEALAEPVVLEGYGPVGVRNELTALVSDPDLEMRHARVTYRIFTLPLQP